MVVKGSEVENQRHAAVRLSACLCTRRCYTLGYKIRAFRFSALLSSLLYLFSVFVLTALLVKSAGTNLKNKSD
jgi:hypothetical protein